MSAYEQLIKKSARWHRLGMKSTKRGGKCIGPPAEPGKHNYLFCINPPLSTDELSELSDRLNARMSDELGRFYLLANGFSCFGRWFKLYGFRKLMRSGELDDLLEQPTDIAFENMVDAWARESRMLLISKYADGCRVYLDSSGRIDVRSIDHQVNCSFGNLEEWVSTELDRFLGCVNDSGSCDIGFSNIPSPRMHPSLTADP